MERKVGEVFTYNGKTYQVVESNMCKDCAFFNTRCNSVQTSVAGTPGGRKDNINVAFKEINNMENNQLTIDIPKGMEIDLENSDLAKGIVKFKKKDITYEDILQVTDSVKLRVSIYCIDKILAISQLMNIAKYYNGDWKPDWSNIDKYKYYIIYNGSDNTYTIADNSIYNYSNIYFKDWKDAQAVIDNPNFRDILDAVYKN
jgi:hypothetical protein